MLNPTTIKTKTVFLILVTLVLWIGIRVPSAGSETDELLAKDMAIINGKAPNAIMLGAHKLALNEKVIMVTLTSSFVDLDGEVISLEKLKIPCKAHIKFRRKSVESEPELERLVVKEYPADAVADFTLNILYVHSSE